MKRLGASSVFVQALLLVAVTAAAAQAIMAVAVHEMEKSRQAFNYEAVAATYLAAPRVRPDEALSVSYVDAPLAAWSRDDQYERRARATVAALVGVPMERVAAERRIYLPGGAWLVRQLFPATPEDDAPVQPFSRDRLFEEIALAVQLDDGRWMIVQPPSPWLLHVGRFVLVWLLGIALVLVPLTWWFTRRLVAPIRAFADTAERAGQGDRDATFPATGPKEIRTAAHALSEMQRRITGAVEERTRLIAAVAHDLRAPLTRLRFRAEYAPPEHRDRIVHDIERMDAMIAGVLAFARGEERLDRQRLDLAALVQSMVDDLAETGQDVEIVEAEPVEVLGDALALRRLVANLLDNAVKYGGSARCRVSRVGDDAVLLIDDAGPGLAEADLERMFTPFERGDASRDPATGGIGLGLALARGIARAHGGDVWLGPSPMGGLRAHVRLPGAGIATR